MMLEIPYLQAKCGRIQMKNTHAMGGWAWDAAALATGPDSGSLWEDL